MLRLRRHLFADAAVAVIPLRKQKLAKLQALEPQMIVSGNVGCIAHLQSGTPIPVVHWIQLVEHLLYG